MSVLVADRKRLLAALHDVEDPELPVSIVDLGLVVDLNVVDARVDVKITFTAMGCPGMDMIVEDVRARLLQERGVEDVLVKIVWDPVWTKDRISEEGKAALRECGIAV